MARDGMRRWAASVALMCLAASGLGASDDLYRSLVVLPSLARIRAHYADVARLGSRLAGSSGEAKTLDYAETRLRALGLSARREDFRVTVPDPGASATLSIGDTRIPLSPLWPNLVRTSTCNVRGPVVDGGDGSLEALSHERIKGSIVVLDFDCGKAWTNAAMLGASAILFRTQAPSPLGRRGAGMTRAEAEAKFKSAPLDIPRFLLPAGVNPAGDGRIVCRQDWVSRPCANLIAELPGTDPSLEKEPIVLWAYADSMSIAPSDAPGAEQSGGLVALLELASILKSTGHGRPVEFVVTGAHCLDVQGTREFVERRMSGRGQNPLLVVTLDLSTASKALGVFGRGYAYNYRDEILGSILPLCRVLRAHAEQLTPLLGETLPRVVLTDAANHSDNRTWKNNIPAKFAFDCEPFMSAGFNAITFATVDDARPLVDTPADTFDRVTPENLFRQIQVLTVMLHHLLNDPIGQTGDDVLPISPPSPSRISLIGGFATASGYVAAYDPTKSLVPDLRIPGSLAVHISNKKTMMGVRGNDVQLTEGENAEYRFVGLPPLTDYATMFKPDTVLAAYHLDPATGRVDEAPDLGAFGAEAFPLVTGLKTSSRSSPIVLFPCVATNLFGLTDPQELTPFESATILDPVGGGAPRSYGLARPYSDPTTPSEADDTAVLFLSPGQRFQLLMGSDLGENRLILTGSTPKNEAGAGYSADGRSFGDVALATARDIAAINQGRIEEFARYRILGGTVATLQKEALDEIGKAEAAEKDRDWAEAQRHGRAAWALALRAHPILQGIAADVVDGVIFYSFLLIPFSFFFERLVFASRSLARQIAITVGVFIASFVTLKLVHPAFDIVANPAMIFVGFVMGALSLIVTAFIAGKFERAMREVKQAQSGVRELDVKRSNVAMAAFSLGISNLRRRKARTLLTILTLVVMTFIVLSFTSIVPDLQLTQTPSGTTGRYAGILLRDPGLDPLRGSAFDALANEFAGRATVVRRVYSYGADIRQGASMSLQNGDTWADADAMLGLDPGEASLSRPQEALLPGGRWFQPGEKDAAILPKPIADALKVRTGARVRFMGLPFTVIGIFDPEKMKRVVDLDGESLMPPDFAQSGQEQRMSHSQTQAYRKFVRLDPATCFFLPATMALSLGGDLRSVAVGFADPAATESAMASLMPRLRLNLYASAPEGGRLEVRRFSILQGSKSTGLALVLIQLAIAAVFVLNTMIASVYERTREISIFSAIGLAPNHIATLFFAESLVYGVLGVVLGYFAAQGVAKAIVVTGAYPALTLNFSSASAIRSALLVVGTVLLSTIYPARRAARIAAPAMAEQSLESMPEGDIWTVPLPFSVSDSEAGPIVAFLEDWLKSYEEYTIGAFVTSGTSLNRSERGYRLSATAWLAPYDLGVSQDLLIDAEPGVAQGTYALTLTLRRTAGEPGNWTTLNRRFLTAIRRQFLAWRTLSEQERSRFAG
ncbi:MAG TPA: FtsX-like permease family protein [Fimbriimonadaceae bacterium]|nr:FtsX-like permease family protein [Fimbriimonadaceae bacterium]